MSYETCKRITVLVINIIIFALGVASIVLNAMYDINSYYYYPCSVVLATMILGVIGACANVRVLLIIAAILCWIFAAIEIANIVVIWVSYGRCIHNNGENTDGCYLNTIIWMTTAFTACLLLLILSGVYTLKLSREIMSRRNGITVVHNSAKLLE